MRASDFLTEAFNQPYPIRWEEGEFGDYDALATLSDGTYLSIMFNKEGEDLWQVEFYRNNSQSITNEGDAYRVFATVLSAIQQFIKEEHPWRILFSANKDVEPGQNSQSRSKLYSTLVSRYARAWGYGIVIEDNFSQVFYELTRLKEEIASELAEDAVNYNISIVKPSQLTAEQLQQVHSLISAGGEVRAETLSAGLQRAQLIAIAEDGDKVVAVTAVKTPLESYRTGVFTKAGVPELLNKYQYESGLSYTDPAYRSTGVSAQLHRQLFQQTQEPLWATVRSENRVALLGLQRMGFKPIGEPFASERGNYTITLLVNR